ncbi:MAG: PilC/PilY family type IV pilus protein [Wenzhouxiangellaceae bacterium]
MMYRMRLILFITITGWLAGTSMPAQGMLLNLPETPLLIGISSKPNVFFMMDDSGSMDWEVLTGNHWPSCRYTEEFSRSCVGGEWSDTMIFTGRTGGLFNWLYYGDVTENVTNAGCPQFQSSSDSASLRACLYPRVKTDPLAQDWRFMSSDLNLMTFNPNIDYLPWTGFSNADFNSARSNPMPGAPGYGRIIDMVDFEFTVWLDTAGWSGSRPNSDGSDFNNNPNGVVDLWDSHIRVKVSNSGISCTQVDYAPSGGLLNPTTRTVGGSACREAAGNQDISKLKQNIANWYSYSRRRSFIAKSAMGEVLNILPNFRYGMSLINRNSQLFVEMPSRELADFTEHNKIMLENFYQHQWFNDITPLRRGLDFVGDYYKNELPQYPSPIISSCQKNFTLLFTDGFWNQTPPPGIGDRDGDGANGGETTLADVGLEYYDTDLRSDLDDNVPTDPFDSNNRQHMVTYTVSFGLEAALQDTDGDGWPNPPLVESSSEWWNTASTTNTRKVDDLWHTAYNAHGVYIAAQRPEDVADALLAVLQNIAARAGSAASGATNGGSITTESRVYQAKFFSKDWHGELLSFRVQSDGSLATSAEWEAGNLLNQKADGYFESTRKVFTYNPQSNAGSRFLWGSLTPEQQLLLDTNPLTRLPDGLGEDRVNYLRGSSRDEGNTGSAFRERENKLGDLVNSAPRFVGRPAFLFPFDNYFAFAQAQENRTQAIYVGGNDGMLHAFDAVSGQELFAYIPNEVMPRLNQLTSRSYSHLFYVDGSPIYSDAQIDGSWRSILTGGLRRGGQAVYALDVTDPAAFTASDILWEFTDADDSDLGYTYGEPTVARMQNGRWAIIIGNGLNNTELDDNPSLTGDAVLYILFIERGRDGWSLGDYVKLSTGEGEVTEPNGLGSPGAVDVDGDFKTDFIYAGDLRGNLWKFDVSGSSPSSWNVAFGGEPLFTARSESGEVLTTLERPGVAFHPTGGEQGTLVYVGTGRFLEPQDNFASDQPTQTLYAVWDRDGFIDPVTGQAGNTGDHGYNRSQMAQIVLNSAGGLRTVADSSEEVVWFNDNGEPVHRGWFVDLPATGERIIEPVLLRSNVVFFVTMIPDDDPCAAGGTGFLMALDSRTGQAPQFPVIDLNNDNDFDEGDMIGGNSDIVPVGLEQGSIPNLPVVIFDPRSLCERDPGNPACVDDNGNPLPGLNGGPFPPPQNAPRACGSDGNLAYFYITASNGSISAVTTNPNDLRCGRQAWRQIR